MCACLKSALKSYFYSLCIRTVICLHRAQQDHSHTGQMRRMTAHTRREHRVIGGQRRADVLKSIKFNLTSACLIQLLICQRGSEGSQTLSVWRNNIWAGKLLAGWRVLVTDGSWLLPFRVWKTPALRAAGCSTPSRGRVQVCLLLRKQRRRRREDDWAGSALNLISGQRSRLCDFWLSVGMDLLWLSAKQFSEVLADCKNVSTVVTTSEKHSCGCATAVKKKVRKSCSFWPFVTFLKFLYFFAQLFIRVPSAMEDVNTTACSSLPLISAVAVRQTMCWLRTASIVNVSITGVSQHLTHINA